MASDDHKKLINRFDRANTSCSEIVLPLEEEHYFYSSYAQYKDQLGILVSRIQSLLTNLPGAGPTADVSIFKDVDDAYEWASGLLDTTLDNVDDALANHRLEITLRSQHSSREAAPESVVPASLAPVIQPAAQTRRSQGYVSYMASPLKEKPQKNFEDTVDNSNVPFVHKLENLRGIIDVEKAKDDAEAARATDSPRPHPLQAQLDTLQYPEWATNPPVETKMYRSFEETPFTYVDTVAGLEAAAERLLKSSELAVDLEAHNYRSFQGFCCLMQLSTREEDIIIDTLALRSHIGRVLAPIFANPVVVKVLHGADGDIVWLQRDYGIFVCNLFDTGQAARVLGYPGHGLGYLLERLCEFKADKRWQLADWRLRPLGEQALHYARADTHFLLYCYDVLRKELMDLGDRVLEHRIPEYLKITAEHPALAGTPGGALGLVLERSRRLCLQQYEKELMKESSFLDLYDKLRLSTEFTDDQLSVFAAMHAWRDTVCREEDESLGYVLSRQQLIDLARALPLTYGDLTRVLGRGSPVVQRRHKELLAAVISARTEEGKKKVSEMRKDRKKAAIARATEGISSPSIPTDLQAAAAAAAGEQPALERVPPPPPTLQPKAVKAVSLSGRSPPGGRAFGVDPSSLPLKKKPLPSLTVATVSSAFGNLVMGRDESTAVNAADTGGMPDAAFAVHSKIKASIALPFGSGCRPGAEDFGTSTDPGGSNQQDAPQASGSVPFPGNKDRMFDQRVAVRAAVSELAAAEAEQPIEREEDRLGAPPLGTSIISKNRMEEGEEERDEEAEDETPAEFLPLSVSDKYGIKSSRKKRRKGTAAAAGRTEKREIPKIPQQNVKKVKHDEPHTIGDAGAAAKRIQQTFKDLGLDQDDEAHADAADSGGTGGIQAVDYSTAAAKYDLGITNPHAKKSAGGRDGRGRGRGRGRGQGSGKGSARGRGRGDEDDGRAIPAGRFNPYAAIDLTSVKGGKRSAVHVRSGNRSSFP